MTIDCAVIIVTTLPVVARNVKPKTNVVDAVPPTAGQAPERLRANGMTQKIIPTRPPTIATGRLPKALVSGDTRKKEPTTLANSRIG